MAGEDPITLWVAGLKADEVAAMENLWQRYFHRVRGMARKILSGGPKRTADESDVAQSAFRSFVIRARKGLFPKLDDRIDLWRILATITVRKAVKQKHKQARQRSAATDVELVKAVLSEKPRLESEIMVRDEIQRLKELLDPDAQRVLTLVLEGHSTAEIAKQCELSRATIERKRKLIRETWLRELEP
jgi:RNA polymerase sigma factor (sigma-70 family)